MSRESLRLWLIEVLLLSKLTAEIFILSRLEMTVYYTVGAEVDSLTTKVNAGLVIWKMPRYPK